MRCIMPTVMKDPIIDEVEADALMSDPYKILDLDLVRCTKKELQFATQYKLRMNFADKVHGLVAWFDTPFSNLENPVVLSTSPHQKKTHWTQTVFYMERDLWVQKGDVIYGSIAVKKNK